MTTSSNFLLTYSTKSFAPAIQTSDFNTHALSFLYTSGRAVDPDSGKPDPDKDPDPAFKVNPNPGSGF